MAIITTGNHPKALWPGVKANWGVGYGEHGFEEWRDLVEVDTSSQNYEEDVQTIGMGLAPIKREGQATTYSATIQGYVSRFVHIAYSLGFIVTYEELKDNLYPKVAGARAKSLGFSMRQTKENVIANIYNRAFTSDYAGGDGKELLATDHPSDIGSQANEPAAGTDLNETSIEDLTIQIMKAKDHKGLRVSLLPRCLIVPPDLWYEANRILESVLQSNSANNDTNVLRTKNVFPEGIKLNHYLTDTDAWFIRTNCMDSLKMYQRDSFDLKKDNDFDTDNAKAKSYDRYSTGWSDWRGLYGSPGA